MSEVRKEVGWPVVVAILAAVVVVPLGVYAGAYFAMSKPLYFSGLPGSAPDMRLYSTQWQATMFSPAASMESRICGHRVKAVDPSIFYDSRSP